MDATTAEILLVKDETPLKRAMKDIAAGSVGGLMQVFAGHPLDTIKVKLQTQKVIPGQPAMYTGLVDCIKKTYHHEGVAGFYRGVMSPIAGVSFFNAALFLVFGQTKAIMTNNDPNATLTIRQNFIAGGITGAFVSLIECPVDLLKIKMQSQTVVAGAAPQFSGVGDAASQIFSRYGLRGVYQGLGSTAIRNIPANSLYFGFYELSKKVLTPVGEDPSVGALFLSGGIGGLAYWSFIYPAEMIKTRIQSDSIVRGERQYKHFLDCFTKTYRHEGAGALFKGFSACMLRAFPANAACFLAYEQAKKYIGLL
eukprot:GILK01002115.1.p1 GENE.GILK01002115.1~~GILK01002115.1.p1  ORF type:complete len:310 (-),score=50.22 GILK01002115.1:112-1041(-)